MCSLGYSAHLLLSQPLSSVFGWVWVSLSLKWGHSVLIQLYLHSPDLCSSLSWWSCLLLGVIFSRDLWNLLPLASRTLFFHLAVFMPLAMATPLFPHLFPMKWWDRMPSECWALSQLFHSPLWLSSRGFFSSSSLSAIRVVSSAYLRLLIFLPAILTPACASSSPAFLMMYSAYVK